MRATLLLVMSIIGTGCFVFGQTVPAPSRFDVVSIKPSTALNTNKTFRFTPDGGFRAGNYSLKDLIRLGWDVRNFQIAGGPGWLDTERYDVQTKPDAPFSPLSAEGEVRNREMVQRMLQDRFRLQVHEQKKEMNVYYLVLAQGSPKLKRTGDAREPATQMRDGRGQMWATKFDMDLFARYLGGELGFPVIDQTGLTGVYDFELAWNPDDGKTEGGTDSHPTMVTAIKEQLGLELKRGKGSVEMVVVDSAEKASAN
jgi:uncharacterized protein (TIGR03435 family)